MKRILLVLGIWVLSLRASAQQQEAEQLLLNWEKLLQLKELLQRMQKGYEVVSAGYDQVRDMAQGNFELHRQFLDGLLEVSPTVKSYARIAAIIRDQHTLLREQKAALAFFKATDIFAPEEIRYLEKVYRHLLGESGNTLDELSAVITASTLRMSDAERLQAIDRLSAQLQEGLTFLRSFNHSTKILSLQRQRERAELARSRKIRAVD